MEIRIKDLKKLIVEMLLVEGKKQDMERIQGIIEKNNLDPELDKEVIDKITSALRVHKMGNDLNWIVNFFLNTPEGQTSKEPIEDIAAHINAFKKSKVRMEKMGIESDIDSYSTVSELASAYKKSRGMLSRADLSSVLQTDIVGGSLSPEGDRYDLNKQGEFYPWVVYLPKSRDASCTIGENTSWCTAIQLGEGNNLFYNYVIKDSIFLFYLQYQGTAQEAEDLGLNEADTVLCLGYAPEHGSLYFPEEGEGDGRITVDKNNKGVSKERYYNIINKTTSDSSLAEKILESIEETVKKYEGKHPAKQHLINIVNDRQKLESELDGKSLDVILDFVSSTTYSKETNIPHDIFTEIIDPMILPPTVNRKVSKIIQQGLTEDSYNEINNLCYYYKVICGYREDHEDIRKYLFIFEHFMNQMIPVIKGLVDGPQMTIGTLIGDNIPMIIYEIIEIFYDTWNVRGIKNTRNYIKILDEMFIKAINDSEYELYDKAEGKYIELPLEDMFDIHEEFNGGGDNHILIPTMHKELFLKTKSIKK